jgi:hypothetical protein
VVDNARDAQVFCQYYSISASYSFIHSLSEVGHCDICRQQFYRAIALNIRRKIALRNPGEVGSVYGNKRLLPAVILELGQRVLTAVSY